MKIRTVLADDHVVVRDGIKAIIRRLGENVAIVGEASNGREVLRIAEETDVDVFVLDIAMPGLNGIETTKRLVGLDANAKVVILSMYNDKILVEKAIKSGARGYILKESTPEDIVRAITEVHEGRYFLSPNIAGYLVRGFIHQDADRDDDERLEASLTTRQREILQLICEGLTEKDIADQLNISPHTVHVHKNNIMQSLDIHTKAGIIKYAIRRGIVQV